METKAWAGVCWAHGRVGHGEGAGEGDVVGAGRGCAAERASVAVDTLGDADARGPAGAAEGACGVAQRVHGGVDGAEGAGLCGGDEEVACVGERGLSGCL